jgi:hypothetical protein
VYGVKASDGRTRKELAGALEHLRAHVQNRPVGSGGSQVSPAIGGFRLREFTQRDQFVQHPVALYECQIRGNDYFLYGQKFANARCGFFIKKPRQDGA